MCRKLPSDSDVQHMHKNWGKQGLVCSCHLSTLEHHEKQVHALVSHAYLYVLGCSTEAQLSSHRTRNILIDRLIDHLIDYLID